MTSVPILSIALLVPAPLLGAVVYVDPSATGGLANGSDWQNAYLDLQQALVAATPTDEIWVAQGTYKPGTDRTDTFQLRTGIAIYGGFPPGGGDGTLGARNPDPMTNGTVLSGDIGTATVTTDNSFHVVTGTGTDATALLDGFKITSGNANQTAGRHHLGAGLVCDSSGSPTLQNLLITANSAKAVGGGVYLNGAEPTFTNVSFTANWTEEGEGGAIYLNQSDATFVNNSLLNNVSPTNGGGLSSHSSSASLTNCTFFGNSATGGVGGAIYETSSSNITLINAILWGNTPEPQISGSVTNASANNLVQGANVSGHIISNEDPLFVDSAGGDLHLYANSPAIDAGDGGANASATDLGGRARILGAQIDLGAYENGGDLLPVNGPANVRYLPGAAAQQDSALDLAAIFDGNPTSYNLLSNSNPAFLPTVIVNGDGTVDLTFADTSMLGSATLMLTASDSLGIGLYSVGIHVQPEVLYVDRSVAAGDGLSWATPYRTLQEALAASVGDGQQIWVAQGLYAPGTQVTDSFELKNGVAIYGGFPRGGGDGTLAARNPNPTTNNTILSGWDPLGAIHSSYHVVTGDDLDATAVLEGFTVQNGDASEAVYPNNRGAGLRASGDLIIRDCRFMNNHASLQGGAVELREGSATLVRCSFSNNSADKFGGALLNITSSSASLIDCSFQDNDAEFGGALYNVDSKPTLTNCSFQGNNATSRGGAFYNTDSELTLTNCSFQGNNADSQGGALYNFDSELTLTNCSFQGNDANSQGGALYNANNALLALTNCVIWNNRASGAIHTPSASVLNSNVLAITYEHCLVENIDLSGLGSGNFDGDDSDNNPLFLDPVDPSRAPTSGGILRLAQGFPALDSGDGDVAASANSSSVDLQHRPRFIGTVDLGGFEGPPLILRVDASAIGGGNHGATWPDAYTDLQDALVDAIHGDQIWLASGVYTPGSLRSDTFVLGLGIALYGGFPTGGGDGTFGARDCQPSTNGTVLSGDHAGDDTNVDGNHIAENSSDIQGDDNAYHVVTVTGSGILHGCTITAGNGNPNGGGMRIENFGSAILTNCSFQGNHADRYGGAIEVLGADCNFTNCLFQGNSAGLGGGAILDGSTALTLTNCSFQGNWAGNRGGAIVDVFSLAGADASLFSSLTNCSFQGNTAGDLGGAVLLRQSSLTNCVIWNNRADDSIDMPKASVAGSEITYSHCLVENIDLSTQGPGNFDGTDSTNAPLFLDPVVPASAPVSGGDLRLLALSPALNAGLNAANSEPTDLAGNPRIQSSGIDLGAYERLADSDDDGLPDAFEEANTIPPSTTSLKPTDDQDHDGFTAVEEFAYGLSDLEPNRIGNPDGGFVHDAGQIYQSIHYRRNRNALPFLHITCERSTDLGILDDWSSGETSEVSSMMNAEDRNVDDVIERSLTEIASQLREFLQIHVSN